MYMENIDGAVLIARRAAQTRYEDLTEKEVTMTKLAILDTVGVIIAATTLGNKAKVFVDLARTTGGNPEATILGTGMKVPAMLAAAANGALAHSLDYDDHIVIGGHQSAGSMEATLAAIEYAGGGSGKDFITAMAVGADIVCRLHMVCPTSTACGWVGTALSGLFGGALGAAKAMKLDEDGITQALGWALWQACFAGQCLDEAGSDARETYCAFSQGKGFLSALLAKLGMKSTVNSFEGQDGLFNRFYKPFTKFNPEFVHVQKGDPFGGKDGAFKPWPSCGQTHTFLQAVRELVSECHITADNIERIDVKVGNLGKRLIENPESRYTPSTANDARFSIPYTIACMVENGDVRLADFETENLPKHYDLAAKVHWVFDQETADFLLNGEGLEPGYVKFTLKDGTTCEKTVAIPYGHTKNPMTVEDVIRKFRDCVSHAAKPISEENIEKIIDMCLNLEKVEDIREFIHLLS